MKLRSDSFIPGAPLPERLAFARHDAVTRVALAENRNPHLAWEDVPEGTRSFVVICVDRDAPTVADDVNRPDREVPEDLPRADFYHWILLDLPAGTRHLEEGAYSHEVTSRGKAGPELPDGTRQGVNDYTQWFASDHDMNGDYYGYDGPCPPWNDARVHRYEFIVHALDVDRLAVDGRFDGRLVTQLIEGHSLGSAKIDGTYTLNARLLPAAG
ncbi:MAG: YbhB/YbcL family Raf kinase inhibitor-like protein [Lautropia sp.]|nr:YbhB/YbcL family Raf kinase inhibitor-like protein [Lautropia sp.]